MTACKVQERLVYDTDAGGIAVGAWPNLMKLARRTATALAATLLPPKTRLLLTQPGLIDRYQLVDLLRSIVEAAKDDAAEPILLLVPGHERGVPKIGDTLIPRSATGAVDLDPEGVDRQRSCSSPRGSHRTAILSMITESSTLLSCCGPRSA